MTEIPLYTIKYYPGLNWCFICKDGISFYKSYTKRKARQLPAGRKTSLCESKKR